MGSIKKVEALLARRNVQGLCTALRDRNAQLRRRAAQALGELGDPAGVLCLKQALLDKDQYVQQWALDSLRSIGDTAAIEALTASYFGADRRLSMLSGQALAALHNSSHASSVLRIREGLLRGDWQVLETLGEHGSRILSQLLGSPLFASWPAAKRREVLHRALALGVVPPQSQRRELAGIGLFVSGLHSIGDVLSGLHNRSPSVRAAAAQRLGASGIKWTTRALWQRFQKEITPAGDRTTAVAIAHAMVNLGDERAIRYLIERLLDSESRVVSDAARLLVEIGTQPVLESLFWFVAAPPSPHAHRNVPQVIAALQGGGSSVIERLQHLKDHEHVRARRLMVELIARCGYPEAEGLLSDLAQDIDTDVQHAALDALSELNTSTAAECIMSLIQVAPPTWIARALMAMTVSRAIELLRVLDPSSTTLTGIVRDNRRALEQARVQVIQHHQFPGQANWGWRAISPRAETDHHGAFALSLFAFEDGWAVRLKIVTPVLSNGRGGEAFTAELALSKGRAHIIQANIDRLFERLVVEIDDLRKESRPN